MKSASAVLVLALLAPCCALAIGDSPVSKALELLTS
eukprot:CAMPEP_0170622634 /NCGR_PEP_ID=MMETSP0224-20130122/29240_1 /TAXON_ID=285029 /ORGANISM="Togula jolla, Strain CCCM 725" /LENGTH=35 /DNA_ID= /DNA_START= /DNA_END= /DNA_ORIENTATION=